MHCAEAASQSLRELSSEAERRDRPSGLKAQNLTQPVWPERVRRHCPEVASQSLRELSAEAERSDRPSGLKAQNKTE